MCLTVFQFSPKSSATCRIDITAHSRETLSASRFLTRAYGSSHPSSSCFGPQCGHATRTRGISSSTACSNTGRSRTVRHCVSCNAGASRRQPPQYAGRLRSRRSAPGATHRAHTLPTRPERKYTVLRPRSPSCLLSAW